MVLAVSPAATTNWTCVASVETGVVRASPEVLGHDVLDERELERGRVVVGDAHDGVGDHRPEHGQGDSEHDRRQDEREDEELQEADQATAATATATAALARDGFRVLRDRLGRVGVGVVRPRLRAARRSRGRPPERIVIG